MPDDTTTNDTTTKSLAEPLADEAGKPLTLKDRLVGIVFALAFAGVGAAMIKWPSFLALDGQQTGRGGRTIAFLLEAGWSRPVGGFLILLALMMLWGSLTKPGVASEASDTNQN